MSTNVAKGTLTQPGATGNSTISLASNFDPKVIILFGNSMTADGDSTSAREAELSYGVGTYRGAAVQQWFISTAAEAGDQTVIHSAKNSNTDALLRFFGANDLDATTPTVDCEIALVSMSTGATSNVVVNWVNLHTTASIVVHYLILGGSDITDALAGSSAGTGGNTTFDIDLSAATGGTGWTGKPDLVGVSSVWDAAGALGNAGNMLSIGWGRLDTEQFVSAMNEGDGLATADPRLYQRSGKILQTITEAGAASYDAALSVKTSWPTNGMQLTFSASTTDRIYWVAIKGASMNAKVGAISTATTTGNQDTALGFAPSGVLWWGGNMAPNAAIQTTGTDLVEYHVGATDGTNHGDAGWSDDDANANQRARMRQSTSKIELVTNAGGTITVLNQGTPSFSVNNFRVNWTTADATAREVLYVAFGSPASGTNVTVNAVPMASIGDVVAPGVDPGVSLAAVPMASIGDIVAPGVDPGFSIAAVPMSSIGDLVTPSVTIAGNVTVTAVPMASVGDLVTPTITADVLVTAVPMASIGDLVAPGVDPAVSVTAVPMLGIGDLVTPVVTSAFNVFAVPMLGLGSLAPVNGIISIVVNVPGFGGLGSLAAPVITLGGNVTVTAVPMASVGDLVAPSLTSSTIVTAVPMLSIGGLVAPSVDPAVGVIAVPMTSIGDIVAAAVDPGFSITAVPMASIGDLVTPAVSINNSVDVFAVPMLGIGDLVTPVVTTDAVITSVPMLSIGDLVTPAVNINNAIDVFAVPMASVGDLVTPIIQSGATIVALPMLGNGDLLVPSIIAGNDITISAIPMTAIGDLVAPTILSGISILALPLQASADVVTPVVISSVLISSIQLDASADLIPPSIFTRLTSIIPGKVDVGRLGEPGVFR